MNSVGAAQQKPAVPPTRLSVVQEAPSIADIVLWQRGADRSRLDRQLEQTDQWREIK